MTQERIDVRDLMIGNQLKQGIVHAIGYSDGGVGWRGVHILENQFMSISKFYKPEQLEPIPLSESWLLDFGFERIVYDSEETGYGVEYTIDLNHKTKLIFQEDFSFGVENKMLGTHWLELDFDTFDGVHHLQNFVKTMTGKELEINKTVNS